MQRQFNRKAQPQIWKPTEPIAKLQPAAAWLTPVDQTPTLIYQRESAWQQQPLPTWQPQAQQPRAQQPRAQQPADWDPMDLD